MKVPQSHFYTGDIQTTVYNYLLSDLGRFVNLEDLSNLSKGCGSLVRSERIDLYKYSHPYVFKVKHQMKNFFKRFIFRDELAGMQALSEKSYDAFELNQTRVATLNVGVKESTYRILRLARSFNKLLLGPYDPDQHISCCKFGKRAAVGLPYKDSYLDVRTCKVLTGSSQHLKWFEEEVIPKDDLLRRVVESTPRRETTCLRLSDVPKAWDKRRTILANTILGGFYTAGLGDYLSLRLRENNYNLNRRAEKHRVWVKEYSRTLSHVTADLSVASDTFTNQIMNVLFPRQWFNAMRFGMIKKCDVRGKQITMSSFMTMGIGHTFPAQTIAFLSILKAIQRVTKAKGRVSVFGDDLIYPMRMHNVVESVFADLGFILNGEKTFTTMPFRESCGADFYEGVDVRPFQPEGEDVLVSGSKCLAHLYKMYNGLSKRWEAEEIPLTLNFLRAEMFRFARKLHQVPFDFPDTSGIQRTLDNHPDYLPCRFDGNNTREIVCLSPSSRLRVVPQQLVYLWDNLRKKNMPVAESCDFTLNLEDRTDLIWVKKKVYRSRYQKPPKLYVRLIPHVHRKGEEPDYRQKVGLALTNANTRLNSKSSRIL